MFSDIVMARIAAVIEIFAKITFTPEELMVLHRQILRMIGTQEEFETEFFLSRSVMTKVVAVVRDFAALQDADAAARAADFKADREFETARAAAAAKTPRAILVKEINELREALELADLKRERDQLKKELFPTN